MTSISPVPGTFVLPQLTTIPDTSTTGTTTGTTAAGTTSSTSSDQAAASGSGSSDWNWSASSQAGYTTPGTGLTVNNLA